MQAIRFSAVAAFSLALAACGGGGSASATSPAISSGGTVTATAAATGIYDVNYGQFRGIYALLDDGRFYGVHFVGSDTLAGHPYGTLSAGNSTSARDPISWANFIDDVQQTGSMEHDARFGRSVSQGTLQVEISSGMGDFSASATAPRAWGDGSAKTLYQDAIPLATLAGNYSASMRSVGVGLPMDWASSFAIDAAGNVSATVGSCNFAGKISQHGSTGVYELQWTASGTGCKFSAPLAGIVMPVSMVNNKPALVFMSHSADAGLTAVFRATHQ